MTEKKYDLDDINLATVLESVFKNKKYLIIGSLIGGLISLFPCFYIKPEWSSNSIFIATTKSNGGIGSISSLANLAGLGISNETATKDSYYEQIIASPDFLRQFVYRTWNVDKGPPKSTSELFELKFDDIKAANKLADVNFLKEIECIEQLQKRISYVKDTKSNTMKLSILAPDPIAAHEMLTALLNALQELNAKDVVTKATQERVFAENQLRSFEVDLVNAENRLTAFRKNNAMLNNPTLLMEQSRLVRNVELYSSLVMEFRKQTELAKLNEEKERSFIDILQKPSIPVYKAKPQRRKIVLGGLLGGLFLAFGYLLIISVRRLK